MLNQINSMLENNNQVSFGIKIPISHRLPHKTKATQRADSFIRTIPQKQSNIPAVEISQLPITETRIETPVIEIETHKKIEAPLLAKKVVKEPEISVATKAKNEFLANKDCVTEITEDGLTKATTKHLDLSESRYYDPKIDEIVKAVNENRNLITVGTKDANGTVVHKMYHKSNPDKVALEYKGWDITGLHPSSERSITVYRYNKSDGTLRDKKVLSSENIDRGCDYIRNYQAAPLQDKNAIEFLKSPMPSIYPLHNEYIDSDLILLLSGRAYN